MAPRIPKRNARFIDSDAETDRGRAAVEMLRGYAGAPSQASVMHPGALRAYEGGELAGMAEMLIPGASLAKGALGAALAGVIKPRGGNWISGSVEGALGGLKKPELSTAMDMYGNIVPNALTNSPTAISNSALNRWIEGPLTKYIKRDMATPEDPVRRLADEGILHYLPEDGTADMEELVEIRDEISGSSFPGASQMGRGDLALSWENLSDYAIQPSTVDEQIKIKSIHGVEPWMRTVDRNTPVYGVNAYDIEYDLGFDHLVDELNNALNPESGLPRNLLLRPEQMQQMGMEKAVRHVDAINKWRAAHQAAANAELANKAMVIREYAENNPKGLRWVELKVGDLPEQLPEGYQLHRYGENKFDLIGPDGKPIASGPLEHVAKEFGRPELEKQLKYEGDTMGHCVGGYCDDVLEGNSRIFSLRDAKGEPHVTIEVDPRSSRFTEDLEDDEFADALEMEALDRGLDPDSDEYQELYEEFANRAVQNLQRTGMPRIAQIKGKQNLAPKDEYLPFVQDFVRNNPLGGGWSNVGDLRNTGLRRVGDKYVTLDELKDMPKTADGFPIGYEPLDDLPEWKDGGVVEFPKITPKAMLNRVISAYNAL